ncbi:MAG: hypothetical protein ACLR2E_17540 [Lachnospiraceae bacterium]
MAFASQKMSSPFWKTFSRRYLRNSAPTRPLPKRLFCRISYKDAMEKYGTDKPDLRIDLLVQDATECMADCGFGPFEGNSRKSSRC